MDPTTNTQIQHLTCTISTPAVEVTYQQADIYAVLPREPCQNGGPTFTVIKYNSRPGALANILLHESMVGKYLYHRQVQTRTGRKSFDLRYEPQGLIIIL